MSPRQPPFLVFVALTIGCGAPASTQPGAPKQPFAKDRVANVKDLLNQLNVQLGDSQADLEVARIDQFRQPQEGSSAAVLVDVYVQWDDQSDSETSGSVELFRLSDSCLGGTLRTRKDDVAMKFPLVLRID